MKKQAKVCYVYILKCADGTLYTGIALDLKTRLRRHNGELAGGAKYTRARRPVKLVYSEKCKNRTKAFAREAEIKSLERSHKMRIIKEMKYEKEIDRF